MGMSASPRNRAVLGVDNPLDGDGFWHGRKFKANRRTGAATGGRVWRRVIRAKENESVRRNMDKEN